MLLTPRSPLPSLSLSLAVALAPARLSLASALSLQLGDPIEPFATPVPTGHILSVPLYAWYKGGEEGEMAYAYAVAGTFYAIASYEGGLVAAAARNFIASMAVVSLYFHAKLRDKASAKTDNGASGSSKAAGGGGGSASSSGSAKKRK